MITRSVLLLAALSLLIPCASAQPDLDFSRLERLPIQDGGRKKPFSTFARETIQAMSGRTAIRPQEIGGNEQWNALKVATALWISPENWDSENLLLVNFRPLKEAIGLDPARKTFSYRELASNEGLREMVGEVQNLRRRNPNAPLDRQQQEVVQVAARVATFENMVTGRSFTIVPHPTEKNGKWVPPQAATTLYPGEAGEAIVEAFEELANAYTSGDAAAFSMAIERMEELLRGLAPDMMPSQRIIELEHFYYAFHPFRWAWVACALGGIVLAATSVWGRAGGYRIGWGFAAAGFVLMVFGFVCRTLISGRPPVTNMYESVIWVAFGTVAFALVFELIYRSRVFLLGAMPVAVIALILADTQPTVLDPAINPLVPVLRDNFWLTTHVLSITLSYAAFALALGVAHIVLGKVILGKKPSPALHNYIYRTLQIGVLLLGAGTILGGVWANYSWGRFWDWDPKETWALIAFLSYLFVLHGRVAGYWAGFGLAVGSVVGFLSVVMAWYGVNFVLGAGLHSYGFGTGGFPFILGLTIAELSFVGVAVFRRYTVKKQLVPEAQPPVDPEIAVLR